MTNSTAKKANNTIGHATYINRVTKANYQLGFYYGDFETELSRAWDLVEMVARTQGWNARDIIVKAGK